MIKNKKSQGFMWEHIVAVVLVLLVIVVVGFIFYKQFTEGAGGTGQQIDETKTDKDDDGVKDILDRCCETPASQKDSVDITGCAPDEERKACSEE